MSDDYAKEAVSKLRGHIGYCVSHNSIGLDAVCSGITTIECLAAENERLTAEVDRLTPKPMTLGRAVEVMNVVGYLGQSNWRITRDDGFTSIGCPRFFSALHEETVMHVAQGLLRDAGPIVVREPTTREEK
jgi:hypothetical protein